MRNRLQVSLWGLRLDAQGIVAIAAAPADRPRLRFAIGWPILTKPA
jgi:hypothetical protein